MKYIARINFVILFTILNTVTAATLNVPAPYPTIQAAIEAAANGDTVIVADGTYTGSGNRDISFNGKAIMVQSESGPENCIIDCNGGPNNYHRGFYFYNGEGANSVLDGVTITNGYAEMYGGGIYCQSGSSPTIRNCIISGNKVVADPNGTSTSHGVGVCSEYSSPTITDCKITGNCAVGDSWGGGVSCRGGAPTIENCIIASNSGFRGGGINCLSNTRPRISNCLIVNNVADPSEYGGGIACKDATPEITNCTISGNSAGRGGAIDLISTTATITNAILWDNWPSEIAMTATGTAIVTYSNVEGGWPGEGNINADPLFAAPDDYHLVFGSPCVDAGTNNPLEGLPPTDLDGIARPFDGDYDGEAVADMGAYEFHQSPGSPVLALTPARFKFSCPVGGPNPDAKILEIWNAGGGVLEWVITEDCGWLEVNPSTGDSTGEVDQVVLSADPCGLGSDMYGCVLSVSDPCDSNNIRLVPVTLRVGPTLYVPNDYATIQAAIDAAFDEDEVIVADGVYRGPGNRDIDFKGKSITVRSENGPTNCIIDSQGTSSDPHRGFYFRFCENADSILDGFTITGGYLYGGTLDEGAGIFCLYAGTDPTIRNCIIAGNSAHCGGGISCYRGSPTIINCIITNNDAYHSYGGGLYHWDDSRAAIIGCTISNNRAQSGGGGVYSGYGSNPTLTNCIAWDNTSDSGSDEVSGAVNVSYSDIKGGYLGIGNINSDPKYVDPIAGDYHLSVDSPCIDAGDPNYNPAPEERDIDGEQRVMGGRVDIGADEVSNMLADLNDDGVINVRDFATLAQVWNVTSNDGAWNEDYDFNNDAIIDTADLLILTNGWCEEADTEAPSIPESLTVTAVTSDTVSLDWANSNDNVSVAGYKIYRDGSYVTYSTTSSFTDCSLDAGTTYTYRVSAYDTAYNESGLSDPCQATTNGGS